MSFKGTYTDGKQFKALITAIEPVIEKCIITVSPQGMYISRIDEQSVIMVDMYLPKDQFLSFNLRGTSELTMGIDVKGLKKLLLWMTPDPLSFNFKRNSNMVLTQKRAGLFDERELSLKKFDVDAEHEADAPDKDFKGAATFSTSVFSKIVASHVNKSFNSSLQLILERTKFSFELTGGERINGKTTLKRTTDNPDDRNQLQIDIQGKTRKIRQSVASAQMAKFAQCSELGGRVKVEMAGGDNPIKLTFEIGDDLDGYLCFLIAPQISE